MAKSPFLALTKSSTVGHGVVLKRLGFICLGGRMPGSGYGRGPTDLRIENVRVIFAEQLKVSDGFGRIIG